MLVGSIHDGLSAAVLGIAAIVAVGLTNCSSSSNGSGTGGSTSVDSGITSGAAGKGLGSGGGTSAGGANGDVTASGGSGSGNSASGGSMGNSTSAGDPSGGSAQGGATSGGSNGSVGIGGLLGSGGVTATGGVSASGTAAGGKISTTSSTGVGGKAGSNTGGASGKVGIGGTSGTSAAGGSVTTGGVREGGQAGGVSSNFRLTSTKLADGAAIPVSATCESTAANSQLPPLAWASAPAGTQSFAMVFVDTTLIGGNPPNTNGFHSAMWDIPATVSSLPEGLPAGSPPAGIAGLETVKQKKAPSGNAWLGPCPNFPNTTRTKTDIYQFRLYALNVAALPSNTSSMTIQQIYNYLEALSPLGVAILSGTSNAAATTLK